MPAALLALLLAAAPAPAPGAVVTLPGLQYQVLRAGPPGGEHPTRASTVAVHYEGRLADGTVFSTSPEDGKGESVFELQKLIPGWIAALQLMRPGDVWRLTLPPHLAYGARGRAPTIPPDSTLIFQVELLSVRTPPPAT